MKISVHLIIIIIVVFKRCTFALPIDLFVIYLLNFIPCEITDGLWYMSGNGGSMLLQTGSLVNLDIFDQKVVS